MREERARIEKKDQARKSQTNGVLDSVETPIKIFVKVNSQEDSNKVFCCNCGEEYALDQATLVTIDSATYRACPHCGCMPGVSVVFPVDATAIHDHIQEVPI